MSKQERARSLFVLFLTDLCGVLAVKDPKKIRERVLLVVRSVLTIVEYLEFKSEQEREDLLEAIKQLLDVSPCEDYQQLLRASLHRLQGLQSS